MTRDEQIRIAVDRFLGWQLPKDFSPDAGVQFKPNGAHGTHWWPIGTNILSADQAREMFEQCLPREPVKVSLANQELIKRAIGYLTEVECLDYSFIVTEAHGGVVLQACYPDPDVYKKTAAIQYTRKWLLSPHMTESEIVFTAVKCCLTSMEHRGREGFLYKGARVACPHFDVNDLVRLCVDEKRENAGGRSGEV